MEFGITESALSEFGIMCGCREFYTAEYCITESAIHEFRIRESAKVEFGIAESAIMKFGIRVM